jgi:hypothetical protein
MPDETVWVEISRHPADSANCKVMEVPEDYVTRTLKESWGGNLRVITRSRLSEFQKARQLMLDLYKEIEDNSAKVKLVPVPFHVRPGEGTDA